MTFRAAIFDLDGTLADTLATIAGVANHSLRELGLPDHPLEAYRHFVGDGIVELCRRVLPAGREALLEPLLVIARARYATRYLENARLYDGIAPLLEQLVARGARLAVLSNKPDELTRKTIDGLGIARHFVAVVGQRDGVPKKPDPAGALALLEALEARPEEVLYVGDTAIDMETAQRAGFESVGVSWGFRGRDELVSAGARHLVSAPAAIVPIYDGTRGAV